MQEKYVYHGSSLKVIKPDLSHSRVNIDFGVGFSTTYDEKMAKKWACNKVTSILNRYEVDFGSLYVKRLGADKEWLDYVVSNRIGDNTLAPFDDKEYDVIIGPTADDKLFLAIDLYMDGLIEEDKALEVVNCMNYSNQVVFKNEKAISKGLKFSGEKCITGLEKEELKKQFVADTKLANQRAQEILRRRNRR